MRFDKWKAKIVNYLIYIDVMLNDLVLGLTSLFVNI